MPPSSPAALPAIPIAPVATTSMGGEPDWSVAAEEWGRFLSRIFDVWQEHDQGRVAINLFESMFAQSMGLPALICTSSPNFAANIIGG